MCTHWYRLSLNAICYALTTRSAPALTNLDCIVMEHEIDVSWPLCIVSYKGIVALWSLFLGVAREHTLQADAYALDVVNR
jgi:hypothetical protein